MAVLRPPIRLLREMTIFIAHSLSDDWIPRYILPLIESLGFEVETGRELAGQPIDEGVKRKIERCDGLVAFLTRITPIEGSGRFKASDWVVQEFTHAATLGMLLLEVRETGVDFQGGLAGNRQWIEIDPADRLPAAVELCRALRAWRSGIDIELRLGTPSFVEAIRGRLMDRKYRCLYLLRHRDGREMARIEDAPSPPAAAVSLCMLKMYRGTPSSNFA
jgi:hypothetical protein